MLAGILGTMMATGMAGRSRRGPGFASRGGGGGFGQTAGLAAMGVLAYKAYQQYQQNQATQRPSHDGTLGRGGSYGDAGFDSGFGGGMGASRGGSLGDRLGQAMGGGERGQVDAEFSDQKALLLIRAMIAAANADGQITPDERQRILGQLDEAGASAEERRFVEDELASPKSVDSLLGSVRDQETAEQVLLASAMAIDPDTAAERSYLDYLGARLNLDPERVRGIVGRG